MEFERKLKETESNLKTAALYESRNAKKMNKLRRAHAATCDRGQEITVKLEELKVETNRLVEVLDENFMF